MKKRFYKTKKIILYTTAALLFYATPLPILAAETNTTPTESIPAQSTPAESTPAESTPAENAPAESKPAENTPAEGTPVESTPAESVPADTPATGTPILPQPEESQPPATTPSTDASNVESNPTPPQESLSQPPSSDTTTVTPQPEQPSANPPAPSENSSSQGSFDVTPMSGTYYATTKLNVRSGPSKDSKKLGTLQSGQEITVTGKTADNWYQIQYSGNSAYVSAEFLSDAPLNGTDTSVIVTPSSPDNTIPDDEADVLDDADSDMTLDTQTEEDTEENYSEASGSLLGTPVVVALAVAIFAVLALICYSVYSFFRKDGNTANEYEEDYEEEPYSDEEYYEENYSDEEYYEEPYPVRDYPKGNIQVIRIRTKIILTKIFPIWNTPIKIIQTNSILIISI